MSSIHYIFPPTTNNADASLQMGIWFNLKEFPLLRSVCKEYALAVLKPSYNLDESNRELKFIENEDEFVIYIRLEAEVLNNRLKLLFGLLCKYNIEGNISDFSLSKHRKFIRENLQRHLPELCTIDELQVKGSAVDMAGITYIPEQKYLGIKLDFNIDPGLREAAINFHKSLEHTQLQVESIEKAKQSIMSETEHTMKVLCEPVVLNYCLPLWLEQISGHPQFSESQHKSAIKRTLRINFYDELCGAECFESPETAIGDANIKYRFLNGIFRIIFYFTNNKDLVPIVIELLKKIRPHAVQLDPATISASSFYSIDISDSATKKDIRETIKYLFDLMNNQNRIIFDENTHRQHLRSFFNKHFEMFSVPTARPDARGLYKKVNLKLLEISENNNSDDFVADKFFATALPETAACLQSLIQFYKNPSVEYAKPWGVEKQSITSEIMKLCESYTLNADNDLLLFVTRSVVNHLIIQIADQLKAKINVERSSLKLNDSVDLLWDEKIRPSALYQAYHFVFSLLVDVLYSNQIHAKKAAKTKNDTTNLDTSTYLSLQVERPQVIDFYTECVANTKQIQPPSNVKPKKKKPKNRKKKKGSNTTTGDNQEIPQQNPVKPVECGNSDLISSTDPRPAEENDAPQNTISPQSEDSNIDNQSAQPVMPINPVNATPSTEPPLGTQRVASAEVATEFTLEVPETSVSSTITHDLPDTDDSSLVNEVPGGSPVAQNGITGNQHRFFPSRPAQQMSTSSMPESFPVLSKYMIIPLVLMNKDFIDILTQIEQALNLYILKEYNHAQELLDQAMQLLLSEGMRDGGDIDISNDTNPYLGIWFDNAYKYDAYLIVLKWKGDCYMYSKQYVEALKCYNAYIILQSSGLISSLTAFLNFNVHNSLLFLTGQGYWIQMQPPATTDPAEPGPVSTTDPVEPTDEPDINTFKLTP